MFLYQNRFLVFISFGEFSFAIHNSESIFWLGVCWRSYRVWMFFIWCFVNCRLCIYMFILCAATSRKAGSNQVTTTQTRMARSISVKDMIVVMEREPQMSKSTLLYRLHERIQSDTAIASSNWKKEKQRDPIHQSVWRALMALSPHYREAWNCKICKSLDRYESSSITKLRAYDIGHIICQGNPFCWRVCIQAWTGS